MAIYLNGAVHHIYEVPLAGDALSHALATNLNISLDTAERLKITHGCCHDSVLVDDYQIDLASLDGAGSVTVGIDVVTQILRRHVTELLDIVNTNIIHSGYDHLVKNVVLTGGTSLLNGFPELAKDILVRSVRVGYPRVSGAIDRDVDNPMFSTAVGLILYGQSHQARVSGTQPAEMGRIAKAIQAVRGIFNG
jgi:cell division protein FtsA